MNLEQSQIQVRTRPQRIAVLVNEHLSRNQVVALIGFLSRVWGGRYAIILGITDKDNGIFVKRCLSSIRPEVVLGVDIDRVKWMEICSQICQPRTFSILDLSEKNLKAFIRDNFSGLIWAENTTWAELKISPEMRRPNLQLIEQDEDSVLSPLLSASFGLVPGNKVEDFAKDLNAGVKSRDATVDISLYLDTCSEMSQKWSWLDFASYRLDRHQIHTMYTIFAPVVVLVDTTMPIMDIALFWNLRMQYGPGSSGRIVLFPIDQIQVKSSVEVLVRWLTSCEINSNYCIIASETGNLGVSESLARRIRPRLRKPLSRITYVDVMEPPQGIPLVIPYNTEVYRRLITSGNVVLVEEANLFYKDYLPSSAAWMCDLVKDARTGRQPYDLCIPPRMSSIQVLNSPNPPQLRLGTNTVGLGCDSINVRLVKSENTTSFRVPTSEELLEEILVELGVQPLKDEKRTRYVQAMAILGGFSEAAILLSGDSLRIIEVLRNNKLTFGQIKGKAKLGKAQTKPTPLFLELTKDFPQHSKNIAERRYAEYSKRNLSRHATAEEIIEKLVERGVLKRKWKLDNCPFCEKVYWVDDLKINGPMVCPGCQRTIPLKDKFELGYELNELVGLAIEEGIVPVVLTARFLKHLTSSGFQWISGVKCSWKSGKSDLDIFSCCDGHLVAAECKTLDKIGNKSKTWKEIADQLDRQIDLLISCGVEVLVIGAMCTEFPKWFIKRVINSCRRDISSVFLTRDDLLSGERRMPFGKGQTRRMSLVDVLIADKSEKMRRRRKKGGRTVSF